MSTVLVLTADMMFLPQLMAAGTQLGCEAQLCISPAMLIERASAAPTDLVILDLSTPRLDPRDLVPKLRQLAAPPRAIIAYGPHVHEAKLTTAAEAGCDAVLTRGQFNAQMSAVLQKYCGRGQP